MQNLLLFLLLVSNSNDQNNSSNFSPVVTLNIVPKIYEPIIKNQLTLILNNTFSPYIAAYRESYTTQHVLTCTNQITWRMERKT